MFKLVALGGWVSFYTLWWLLLLGKVVVSIPVAASFVCFFGIAFFFSVVTSPPVEVSQRKKQ